LLENLVGSLKGLKNCVGMATLTAIGLTAVAGTCGFAVSMISFGLATWKQSTFIAPRCIGRPKTVIYNPNPTDATQDRGNLFWGWVPWVMKLTYATMLGGVPGTGTRDDGRSGLLLKVNLDGIVLMRFHHLCFRVSILAAFLYTLIVLPVFRTSRCSMVSGDFDSPSCLTQTISDYERFTIENVTPLNNTITPLSKNSVEDEGRGSILARLYTVVFVSWIITYYTYKLLEKEWRDILALRRVYYLEADHWSDRKAELEETLLREEREKDNESTKKIDSDGELEKNYTKTRDPWVHHPEQRDTVPNIELYSVLVGGLPSLPTDAFLQADVKAVFSRKQSIDWQLAVTSAFFDHCVPNQPGFSSSVAAVTILPAANQITKAWKHWYNTAARVRRLRFIRKQISKRKDVDQSRKKKTEIDFGDESVDHKANRSFYKKLTRKHKKEKKKQKKKKRKSSVYSESAEKKKYFSEFLGDTEDLEVEKNLLHALKLGPEQTTVYSREFAQGAANCAPYGWNENKVRNASLTELLEMEKDATIAVQEASYALREAQDMIAENDIDGKHCNDEDLNDLMVSASNTGKSIFADKGSQQQDGIASGKQTMMKNENIPGNSSFREGWLNFSTKISSLVDSGVNNATSNQSSTSNVVHGIRDNRWSLSNNLEVVAPAEDFKRISGKSIENKKPKVSGVAQGGLTSLNNMNQSKHRNSSVILEDLMLEAGLFLEQKTLSNGHSQHKPRNLLRARSAEDLDLYKDDSDKYSFASEELDGEPDLRSSFRRSKSSDDVLLKQFEVNIFPGFYEETEFDLNSSQSVLPPPTGIENKEKMEREKLGYERTDMGETNATSRTHLIWDKIASENERRSQIRKRIENMSKINQAVKLTDAKRISSSDIEEIETKRISFSDAEEIETPNEKSDNNSTLNGISNAMVDNISRRRSADSRMFSIDESSIQSFKMYESDHFSTKTGSVRTGLGSMRQFDRSGKDDPYSTVDQDLRLSYAFEEKAGLRRRQSNSTADRLSKTITEKWSKVVQIANESSSRRSKVDGVEPIESGSYSICEFYGLLERTILILKNLFFRSRWQNNSSDIVDPFDLAGESTFAVVTFTSRQAAVAARHCLSDSRGADRWNTVSEIPSPPLADAAVFNLSSFRGCVRPVTISINDRQKMIRHVLALAILGSIYIFYILPLTAVQEWLSPEILQGILPNLDNWLQNEFAKYIFSGFIPALVWTGFYAVCPPMFKAIANFGSNATSAACAEGSALRYFWWFMIVSAFTGTSLAAAVLKGFQKEEEIDNISEIDTEEEIDIISGFQYVIVSAARSIPKSVSATWLNWIIVRVSLVLPTQYILQMNPMLFTCLRLKALARAVQGGGSGGPIPYRIYVDSGVVMLCLLALAPASPLIAIAAFVYFLFCVPMLRWTLVFLYKPKFDIGGARFPFIFDMCVSGMVMGHILLGTMLFIREAYGPAFVAFVPLLPTIFYRWVLLKRYLKAFTDVALLQTSLLDGWDTNKESSRSKREEFRRFLVDCHKAAYVPVCIASDEMTDISSEPAVVMPLETDMYEDYDDVTSVNTETPSIAGDVESLHGTTRTSEHQMMYHPHQPQNQPGRMMRRASHGPSTYNSTSPYDDNIISIPSDGVYSPRTKKRYIAKPLIV